MDNADQAAENLNEEISTNLCAHASFHSHQVSDLLIKK